MAHFHRVPSGQHAVTLVGGAFSSNARLRVNRMFQDGRVHLEVISAQS
jgi:hypothetical protein